MVFGCNFIDKYNLEVDESLEAKSNYLYNAANELMEISAILDIQTMFNGALGWASCSK